MGENWQQCQVCLGEFIPDGPDETRCPACEKTMQKMFRFMYAVIFAGLIVMAGHFLGWFSFIEDWKDAP